MYKYFPVSQEYNEADEQAIIEQAQKGSREAIERLIKQHQRFVFNIALKLALESNDAADLTQEVLLKVLMKLPQFGFKSSFRTWLYRIVMNHFLNSKRRKAEVELLSFEKLGNTADHLCNDREMSPEEQIVKKEETRYVRNKCMSSALICLDRQQRLVLILGFIFGIPSPEAAPLLGVTPKNFRKILQRTKGDLFGFMDNKCGLMNPENPCRCIKKTKGFMRDGLVDPEKVKFDSRVLQTIEAVVDQKNRQLDDLMEGKYRRLFVEQPWSGPAERTAMIESILTDPEIRDIYGLK